MDKRYFSEKVVEWYELNKRELPWRENRDAYRIWLSEIILQQTRVVQGLPYYKKFTEEFPEIKDLANAKEQKVLRLWQGLGYYTRARNLHKCAK
jgi:A/G-specific adenine glycosylase